MNTVLTPDVLYACLWIFVVPMSFVLVGILIARSQSVISNENLEIEKEKLYNEIRNDLAKRGIHLQSVGAPEIQWNHIDGPVLHLSTAGLVWLTFRDRFLLWTKLTSVDKLNIRYCRKELSLPLQPTTH